MIEKNKKIIKNIEEIDKTMENIDKEIAQFSRDLITSQKHINIFPENSWELLEEQE